MRRQPAFIAHFFLRGGEEIVEAEFHAADAVAQVAGIAIERGHGLDDGILSTPPLSKGGTGLAPPLTKGGLRGVAPKRRYQGGSLRFIQAIARRFGSIRPDRFRQAAGACFELGKFGRPECGHNIGVAVL